MKYGYDRKSGALFSLNRDFQYEGRAAVSPEGAAVSEDGQIDDTVGCAFLSGWDGIFVVVWSDGQTEKLSLCGRDRKTGLWVGCGIPASEKMSKHPVCVCGPVVRYPDKIAEICGRFPVSRMYVCPMVDELAAFGVLVRTTVARPRRIYFAVNNTARIDAESRLFDPKLEGDGLGKMADYVAQGAPVLNEMMTVVGVSPFYGRVLHNGAFGKQTCIVRMAEMDKLFPQEPVSAKSYAVTMVPVRMKTTPQLAEKTSVKAEYVDVFAATDYVPGVTVFMRFHHAICRKGIVWTTQRESLPPLPGLLVFRSDREYRVKA
jgi:hypothetical protein